MTDIAYWIWIGGLGIALFCTVLINILTLKKQENTIQNMEDSYDFLRTRYTETLDEINDINGRYSKSLDDREKFLNDCTVKIKRLEIELEAKNAEIERLTRRIAVVELPVDISKITEVKHEEKET